MTSWNDDADNLAGFRRLVAWCLIALVIILSVAVVLGDLIGQIVGL